MKIADQLAQEAIEIANRLKARASALKPELLEIETRKAEIEAQLHAANLCHKRLSHFRPEIDGDFQCPSCWVRNEQPSPLIPTSSPDSDDHFRCRTCHAEFSFSI